MGELTNSEIKDFTQFKFRVLDGLSFDHRVKGNTFMVAVRLMQCVNAQTFKAFPSQDVLAAELGISRTTVKAALKQLEQFGWLKVRDNAQSNTYEFNDRQYQSLKDDRDLFVELAREKSKERSKLSFERKQARRLSESVGQ